jgi:hypothetical protein
LVCLVDLVQLVCLSGMFGLFGLFGVWSVWFGLFQEPFRVGELGKDLPSEQNGHSHMYTCKYLHKVLAPAAGTHMVAGD